MGPFPIAMRYLKFLIVGIDYFIKWVEAEALATITEKNVRSFVWRSIICRLGIPKVLVSDNRKQFNNVRLDSMGQRVYGLKSCQAFYGYIRQQ